QLWTYVYRPYLQFLYMTNAYHFYSPDPGPPNHLWFSVTYEDGSWEWVKYPNRKTSSVGMQYQRHLALPEHSFTPRPTLPYSAAQIEVLRRTQSDEEVERQALGGSWEQIYKRRMDGSLQLAYAGKWEQNGKPVELAMPIPMDLERDLNIFMQYREPTETSKKLIASVARRVFLTAPKKIDENDKQAPVK